MLEKFSQRFGFTTSESRVIVFLVASFFVGLGINYMKDASAGPTMFDYSLADSEFAARSRAGTAEKDADSAAEQTGSEHRQDEETAGPERQLLDINSATNADFVRLPGIGEAIAERLVAYRKEHGRFGSLEELLRVKGIGKKKFEQIRSYCIVR